MKFCILLLATVVGALALPTREQQLQQWENFKVTHQRQYADAKEEAFRRELFLTKLRHIEAHNANYEKGLSTYKLGINQFSDFTDAEMHAYTHGVRRPSNPPKGAQYLPKNYQVPDSMDWRDQGVIPPVKNQGGCGSCWAFSANGALEAHLRIYRNEAPSLSEQNLVDCVTTNAGCGGGWMDNAYQYIHDNNGIDSEASYPYEAVDGPCRYNPANRAAGVQGFVDIPFGDENAMKEAVGAQGPLAIAIDVSGDWGSYTGGVYYNATCNPYNTIHAVVIVGYGNENGQDYWQVRNSWGANWGDNGYIKMARNRDNNCGVGTAASYPLV